MPEPVDEGGTMPPHCDSLDGPVVTAARRALEGGDVASVLPYVPASGEDEIRALFGTVLPLRAQGGPVREVADRLFFETVVRVHRAGEGAAYTGLKPAGLDVGPALPLAERAIETGSCTQLADFLSGVLHEQLEHRLERVGALAASRDRSVSDARRYVEAMLGFEVYSHHLYQALQASAHGESGHE
jgi:hypothetical protein